jgi:hypothetical protein
VLTAKTSAEDAPRARRSERGAAGALFKWRWIRNLAFRLAHLGLVLYVAGESILGVTCPLTDWEYQLRLTAGQRGEQNISFVGRLIRSLLFYDFPPAFFTAMYVGFGVLVLAACVFVRPRRKGYDAADPGSPL